MENARILVVDDEESLCEILQYNLEREGYIVDVAYSAEQALTMNLSVYDLLLLDIMMGDISGLELARILKKDPATGSIPIIFCTAKNTEDDTVTGLELGGDDYIAKPFAIREVIARVKSVLRRSKSSKDEIISNSIIFKNLIINLDNKSCSLYGDDIQLTKKELDILIFFLNNKGKIFSREEILSSVWPNEVIVLDRTIDVNITRLRKKIGEYGKHIVTRTGYGYGFEE